MSMNHQDLEGDSAHVLTWAIASVICLALFALLFWALGPGRGDATSTSNGGLSGDEGAESMMVTIPVPTGMSWPALEIDAERIARARAQQRDAHAANLSRETLSDPVIEEFYATVKELNDHQFVTQPIPSKTPNELEYNFKASLSEVVGNVRPEHFMALGEPLFEECDKGLTALQKDIASGKTTLEDAKADADFEEHERYRKHCGNMLTQLHDLKLVDDKGQWSGPEAKTISSILERYRWAYLVHLYIKPLDLLTPVERVAFLRWRLETDAFSLAQRKRFASSIQSELPTYPEGVVEAMIAYEEGEKRRAAEILSRYRNRSPDDRTYNVMYQALKKELENQ